MFNLLACGSRPAEADLGRLIGFVTLLLDPDISFVCPLHSSEKL